MRHLTVRRAAAARHAGARGQRGLTLVELMVALTIAAVLVVAAVPSFQDYLGNSRLRESGNTLFVQALFAQSEAIKRNTVVRLTTDGAVVRVFDRTDPDNEVLVRETVLADGISAAAADIDFGGEGRPLGFAAGSINLSSAAHACSTEIRCPGLRVDGGGAIRLCGDHQTPCD
jgi:type IV fimbrial biogenesis protein FimT